MKVEIDKSTGYPIYPKEGIFPPFTLFQIFKVIIASIVMIFFAVAWSGNSIANKIFWSIVFAGYYFTSLIWIHHLSKNMVVMVPEVALIPGLLGSFGALGIWIAIVIIMFLTGLPQFLEITMLFPHVFQ